MTQTRGPLLGIAFLALLASIEAMQACLICVPFPGKSAADYLIDAEVVLLAPEDPERPFHFSEVEVLKRDPGEEKIDLFPDSLSRRLLTIYPERTDVLVRKTERDKQV